MGRGGLNKFHALIPRSALSILADVRTQQKKLDRNYVGSTLLLGDALFFLMWCPFDVIRSRWELECGNDGVGRSKLDSPECWTRL